MIAFLKLLRPLTSFMAGFATFVGALVGVGSDITSYVIPISLAFIVVFFFSAAGFVLNDYFDRKTDKVNHPDRPIPSGRIKAKTALEVVVVIFIIVIMLAWLINVLCFAITILALILQISYEKALKQRGFIGNFTISMLAALAFFYGGSAVNQIIVPGILAILAFCAILGREIIMDIEDIRGDVDRLTLPRKIGKKKAAAIASLFLGFAIMMSPIPYYPLKMFSIIYLPIVVIADIVFIYSMFTQIRDPKSARNSTKIAMIIALISFILGAILT